MKETKGYATDGQLKYVIVPALFRSSFLDGPLKEFSSSGQDVPWVATFALFIAHVAG